MRLGLEKEFKLPDYIPTRGHLTLEGKKISKSELRRLIRESIKESFPKDYFKIRSRKIT